MRQNRARRASARGNAGKRFPPEVLAPDEAARLIAACGTLRFTQARDRALVVFLYRTGARVGEALAVTPKDVDVTIGCVRLLHAKGGRSRVVGIDGEAMRELECWMERRAEALAARRTRRERWGEGARIADADHSTPLFCTERGTRLRTGSVRRLMQRLGRRAGLARRVHAHALRHTCAAELRAEGLDIGIISKQLGHASIATTARYLDHIRPMAVIEAMGRRRWGEGTGAS